MKIPINTTPTKPKPVAIYPLSLTGYLLQLNRCRDWAEIQALLTEAEKNLDIHTYNSLHVDAAAKIGRINAVAVGPQKGRWI